MTPGTREAAAAMAPAVPAPAKRVLRDSLLLGWLISCLLDGPRSGRRQPCRSNVAAEKLLCNHTNTESRGRKAQQKACHRVWAGASEANAGCCVAVANGLRQLVGINATTCRPAK